MSRHLRSLGSNFSVSIPTDEEGYLGRECPECESYFKITPGTGLENVTACVCPYCGHKAEQSDFATAQQLEYAKSVVLQQVMGAVTKDLKGIARSFNRKSSGGLLSLKMDVRSKPSTIQYYVEKELETKVQCAACSLQYTIYGVFGFCPDCGVHNSLQILEKNLELARKELELATTAEDTELQQHLVGDALENAVSSFDGFGRAEVGTYADRSSNSKKATAISFQNLTTAEEALQALFGFSLHSTVSADEWKLLVRCFQKRHLLAHKMGVVDEKYMKVTGDTNAVVGRKVVMGSQEVSKLLEAVAKLGIGLSASLDQISPNVQ
ncbi:hypothetical protein [Aeoliella sp.]|uniref:hypothetical protein n=1 Tax=Aeoliella sp. TaxID=2795800 RepID=UPI003CCB9DF4